MPRTGENIYKRKDGRWEARYILFYDENGKAKYRYIAECKRPIKQRISSSVSKVFTTAL